MITLLVDYDDTLNDTSTIYHEKFDGYFGLDGKKFYHLFLHKVHRKIIEKKHPQWHDNIEEHVKILFQILDTKFDQVLSDEIVQQYENAERETWERPRLFPDAIPFLTTASEKGYQINLTTGPQSIKKVESLERIIGKQIFHHAFGEDTLGVLKTDSQYYRLVLEKIGAAPSDTICIGDTLSHDVKPAKAMGITTIWVNRRKNKKYLDAVVDYEADNLDQALRFIETHLTLDH